MSRLVRLATIGDTTQIGDVAAAAWRDTYTGLLEHQTIERFIDAAYSADSIVRRIERDTVLVAEVDDTIRAFADAFEADGHVTLAAIYAEPSWRQHGLGRLLVEEIGRRFPDRSLAADVLVGNRLGEAFYEQLGFVPAEDVEEDLFGETVRERRWWLRQPLAGSSG